MSPRTDAASAFPVIETPRLLLRVPALGDFERYAEAMAHPEASRHIGGVMLRAAAWRRFLQMPGAWLVQGFAMFSVIDKADGRWLGQAGPWHPDGWNGTEVGYSFHPDAWGRGLASEAVQATIDFAFRTLGWDEVIHNIAPANLASQRLAQRVGSRLRGPGRLPEPFAEAEIEIWAQTRTEWAARRA